MPLRWSDQVQEVIEVENLTPNDLENMIARGAKTSLRGATRRFHHWFFVYHEGQGMIERMFKHLPVMDGTKTWVKHDHCSGDGCPACLWSGELPG